VGKVGGRVLDGAVGTSVVPVSSARDVVGSDVVGSVVSVAETVADGGVVVAGGVVVGTTDVGGGVVVSSTWVMPPVLADTTLRGRTLR
jgi:hypothetical protein